MNKKAEELGLENTHFITPHGLDDKEHYTTAYELALLTDYALENEKFSQIVNTKTKTILINGRQQELYNTNELLGNLNGINGVKTGFTNNAGRCLVCSCVRDNMNVISVVLGADTKKFRSKDSIEIIEYVYENYEQINLKEKINLAFEQWKQTYNPSIIKGEKQCFRIDLEEAPCEIYTIKKGTEDSIKINVNVEEVFEAPIKEETIIGKVNVNINGIEIYELNIYCLENINKKSVWTYFTEIIKQIKITSTFP